MGIVEQYLSQLKIEKRRLRRAAAILTALSFLVAIGVSWNLRMTGITIANDATCCLEEHLHSAECALEKVLICGYPEEGAAESYAEATVDHLPAIATIESSRMESEEIETTETTEEEAFEELPEILEPPTESVVEVSGEEIITEPIVEDSVENIIAEPTVEDPAEETITEPTDEEPFESFSDDSAVLTDEVPLVEPQPQHFHTEECYQITYLCNLEEHIHVLSCYSDATADIESPVIWEATLPELTGQWAEDLVLVAQSQIGCGESERNYIVADDGYTRHGITRYGQWYGNPHGDWSAMFAMFCLDYAEIPEKSVPWSPGVYNMMRLAKNEEIFVLPDENTGTIGNLLFLDTDENEKADKVVIVTDSTNEELTVIGGDLDNYVQEIMLLVSDPSILGYINIQEAQANYYEEPDEGTTNETIAPTDIEELDHPTVEPEVPTEAPSNPTEEPGDPAVEPTEPAEGSAGETEEPVITLDVEFPVEGVMRLVAQLNNVDAFMYAWQWQYSEDGNEPWYDIDGATELVCELEDTEENFQRYYRLHGQRMPMMFRAMAVARDPETSSGTVTDGTMITSEVITPFSIGKNNNVYTVDVYALPVDGDGNRIAGLNVTKLSSIRVNSTNKTTVQPLFTGINGTYQSAYFGSETTVNVDNIASVWRYRSGASYYLAYAQTNGTQNQRYMRNADSSISLYLRYIPEFTVSFASDGATTLTEDVVYGNCPTLIEPGEWTRDGYTLVGWTHSGDGSGTVYTYDQIMAMPVTADVTYTAQWRQSVTVSFNLGEYAAQLYPIAPREVSYGDTILPLPTPGWRDNSAVVAFAGWYLNQELSVPVDPAYEFYEDTILYAKWSTDDGYYVYFMDFERDDQTSLVLMTYSVTEGQTTSPYTPSNAPAGTQWDGVWYLDQELTTAYHFTIPVNQMTDYLTGANGRDLYLYPGTQSVCRAIFVTYGTKIDPVTVAFGGTINLDHYIPERDGYLFDGWTLQDGTPVSGEQLLTETTTYYASWASDYVPFEAVLRIENANDTGMSQADILGTWYAKAGSRIRVNSTYSGTGDNRTGTHQVVCVLDGVEYPVYSNAALTREATLSDVYSTYFIYNNAGTSWSDEVNWDDIYTGGELPYSTRPISSSGDTVINFDYMRVRNDITFTISNGNSGAYIDVYKLYQNGLITGSVTYTGSRPTMEGSNVSATGISGTNVRWTYTAASSTSGNNLYTLHDMKYGQRIYEVYPVGSSWLTTRNNSFHWYKAGSGELFSSRRDALSADFYSGSGRKVTPYSLTAVFAAQDKIALMYAIECLSGETADFTINGVGYKVQTHLCEVVNHTGSFSQKELLGCEAEGNSSYGNLNTTNSTIGGTSVRTLFGITYWDIYSLFAGVDSLSDIDTAYIFYYTRQHMNLQFSFAYDSDGDGANEIVEYANVAFGENISEYQYGVPSFGRHELLTRAGYEFSGWLDANGNILQAADWESMVASSDSADGAMIFIAKWEKISNNIVEYYEDVSASVPFETHYFDDGSLLEYPTMIVYPEGWVWREYGDGSLQRFDWDVPMYGEYGVQEVRELDGETAVVNVLRIYGTWDESHTRVVYDPNPAQGGVPGTAPNDDNEYTIWQSEVSVKALGSTSNADPEMVFAGWLLDRDGTVYHPGDHVPVRWPRTMIFTAQWAKKEAVVYLRYAPNGGSPDIFYPTESGFVYRKNATAFVWDNADSGGNAWFIRHGYTFSGWNTEPDGSGMAYAPGSPIVLTETITTLYAQWERDIHTLSLYKVDFETDAPLMGAEFGLYKYENDMYLQIHTMTSGVDGHILYTGLETDVLYKLVEEKPSDGYAIITKDIYFRLLPGENSVILMFYDADGRIISHLSGITGEYITSNRYLTLRVANLRGYELPSTGGMGFPLYILCGLLLVLAPLVYSFSLRRRYERRSKQ